MLRENAGIRNFISVEAHIQSLQVGGDPVENEDGVDVATMLTGAVAGATMVVGEEDTNVVNVAIQLVDGSGNDVEAIGNVTAFLSDAATGIGISGTAPATSVAIGTDGAIIKELTAKLAWILQSEADGDIDIDITETGTATWYLVVILPNGTQVVSDPIVFAA